MLNLPYDFNFSFSIVPYPKLDPDGQILSQIIAMRFVYLYFVNDYGGIDFFPFTDPHLYVSGENRWFRPGTEIRLAYSVKHSTTEFFRPGYLAIFAGYDIKIIARLIIQATFDLRVR